MPDLYQPSPATTFAVQFADLVELATQRDAFLAENDCHVVVHWIEAGQHQVELTFVRDVIPGADQPSHVALRGKGEHFWVALRDVLAQLRAHPDRQDVREALASPQ